MLKQIIVNGHTFTIHGRPGGPYFDRLDIGDKTNDFLYYAADRYVNPGDTVLDIGANIGKATYVRPPRGAAYALSLIPIRSFT